MDRLSWAHLPTGAHVQGPPERGLAEQVGIVHLGIGAFHRAHQAVLTEDAAVATGETGWGICGVTQRSRDVVEALRPQDGLHTVLERGRTRVRARVVAQVREVLAATEDGARLRDRLADPAVRVVTLTVTEKGYRRGADGHLDRADPAVAHDLAHPGSGARSAVGQLVAGLRARAAADAGPVTVLACDNLPAGGRVLRALVEELDAASPGDGRSAAWIAEHVTFPSCVVDRIVPATTEADRRDAQALIGVRDEGVVVAEPFRQWVIEDAFAAGRPRWEAAGALLVDDVAPHEALKLRVLNATHSLLAYLGLHAGHATIAEAVDDPALRAAAQRLVADDVLPTLVPPPGIDAAAYAAEVLERFANPALRHRTAQVATDGSVKLPVRLLGTARDRLAAGAVPESVALAVAAWMAHVVRSTGPDGACRPLDDPLAARLSRSVAAAGDSPRAVARALLGVREVFGTDLPEHAGFTAAVTTHLEELL